MFGSVYNQVNSQLLFVVGTFKRSRGIEMLLSCLPWYALMWSIILWPPDVVASMKKSILYLLGLLMLYFFTGLYHDLLGTPSLSKDISLVGRKVWLVALFRCVIVFWSWWHLSPSLLCLPHFWDEMLNRSGQI